MSGEPLRAIRQAKWQQDHETRAKFAGPIIEPSTFALDQRTRDGQTQSRSTLRAFAGEERFEDAVNIAGWNALPFVRKRNATLRAIAGGGDINAAAAGLPRVFNQGRQDSFQPPHLDPDVLSGRKRPPAWAAPPVIAGFAQRADLLFGESGSAKLESTGQFAAIPALSAGQ